MTNATNEIDNYLSRLDPKAKQIIEQLRSMVKELAPNATERISYQMPCFQNGKNYIYIGAFKHHIGIYPPIKWTLELLEKLKPYANKKGNLAFEFKNDIPFALLAEVIKSALLSTE